MKKLPVFLLMLLLMSAFMTAACTEETPFGVRVDIQNSPGAEVDIETTDTSTDGDNSPVNNDDCGTCGDVPAEGLCSPVGCSPIASDDPRCVQNGGQVDCKPCSTCVPQE